MSRSAQLLTVGAAVALAACQSAGGSRTPGPESATAPIAVTVVRYVYVPVRPDLTEPEPIADGPLSEIPRVARERRAALDRANAKLREIAELQGTEVEPQ